MIAPVAAGAVLRIAWAFYAARSTPEFLVSGDQFSYWFLGQEIGAGRGYRLPPFTAASSYYPVGYPALLGLIAFITTHTPLPDSSVLSTAVLQVVMSTAAIALVGFIAGRLWGRRVALLAAWLVALFPNLILAVATYSLETTFITLTLAAVAVLVGHDWSTGELPSTRRLVDFGVVIATAVLVRPFALAVVIGLVLACLVVRGGWRNTARTVAIPVGIVVLSMVPWTIRNAVALDAFVPVSTNLGDTLCLDRTLDANGTFRFSVHEGCAPPDLAEVPRNRANIGKAAKFVLGHPVKELHLWGMRIYRMMLNDRPALIEVEELGEGRFLGHRARTGLGVLADTWFFTIGSLALFGTWRAGRANWREPRRLVVFTTGIALMVIPMLLWGAPRFHVPLEPFMAIAAAVGIDSLRSRELCRSQHPQPVQTDKGHGRPLH